MTYFGQFDEIEKEVIVIHEKNRIKRKGYVNRYS